MSLTERERRELSDLASSAADGCISDADRTRLEAILRESADARGYYVRFMGLSATLAWNARDESESTGAFQLPRARAALNNDQNRGWWTATAAAAALVFAVVGIWAFARPAAPVANAPAGIATLSTAMNVEWADAQVPGHVGNMLKPGWIRMKSGLAQIDFLNGASMWLEGPIDIRLDSPREAFCESGKLVAQVPRAAGNFRLASPRLTVEENGSGFGVEVNNASHDSLHVFRGTVNVTLHDTRSRTAVEAGQAIVIDRAGTTSIVSADPGAFSREEFNQWGTRTYGMPPWAYDSNSYSMGNSYHGPRNHSPGPPPVMYSGMWKGADPMDFVHDSLATSDDRWNVIRKPLEAFLTEQWKSWGMEMNPDDSLSRAKWNLQFAIDDARINPDAPAADEELAKRLAALRQARSISRELLDQKERALKAVLTSDEEARLVNLGYIP